MRKLKKSGIGLITFERRRQIEEEGWTAEHDDEYTDGSLALAAVCFATPEKLYVKEEHARQICFDDPWPSSWDDKYDKRFEYGSNRRHSSNVIPEPATYSHEERIDLLVKAGALIAAEIDRLNRIKT